MIGYGHGSCLVVNMPFLVVNDAGMMVVHTWQTMV